MLAELPVTSLTRLAAYIDETGDRGLRPNSSPVFGMAAVVLDDSAETVARRQLAIDEPRDLPPIRHLASRPQVSWNMASFSPRAAVTQSPRLGRRKAR